MKHAGSIHEDPLLLSREGRARLSVNRHSADHREMDFSLTPEQIQFRDEVRTWLRANVPPDWGNRPLFGPDSPEELYGFLRQWQRSLSDAGFLGLTWPKEYGGRGLSYMEELIFNEEMALAKAPPILNLLEIGRAHV